MLEPTKKRHTEIVELRVHGPAARKEEARKALKRLGFVEGIPWREAFPEYTEEDLPGVCLRAARQREGMTQVELSRKIGLPQRHISEMENGKRVIGKKNACLFAGVLNVGYKVFL